MTEQEMIAKVAKMEASTERTHAWVVEQARDAKDTNKKLDALMEAIFNLRESVAAFKGRVNVVIGIAATIAACFVAAAVKLMFVNL